MSDTPRTDVMVTGNSEPSVDEYEDLAAFARQLEVECNRVLREQREYFEFAQEARRQFREGTWHGKTTEDYRSSVSVRPDEHTAFFSLEYQWQDKPHRHVNDLCDWINQLQDEIKQLKSK